MSYILEALKKAQAERQLGDSPTIHTPQPAHIAPARGAASRKPLLVGLAAGALVASAAAVLAWRHQAPVQVVAVEPGAAAAVQPSSLAPAPTLPALPAPRPAIAAVSKPPETPAAAPQHAQPEPAAAAPTAPAPKREEARADMDARRKTTLAEREATPAPAPSQAAIPPAPMPAPANAASAVAAAPPVHAEEENLRTLQQLPEAIQREVPKVAFGGYMYSPNPADRLVLVDKTLRHEGEEVAPGLVLEKLLPKAAVLKFRGYRYRVPY